MVARARTPSWTSSIFHSFFLLPLILLSSPHQSLFTSFLPRSQPFLTSIATAGDNPTRVRGDTQTPSSSGANDLPQARSRLSSYSDIGTRGARGGRRGQGMSRASGGGRGKRGKDIAELDGWTKRAQAGKRQDAAAADQGRGAGDVEEGRASKKRQEAGREDRGMAGKRRRGNEEEEEGGFDAQEEVEEEGAEDGAKKDRILVIHAPYTNILSAALYDGEARKISVLEDTRDSTSWDLACLVMEQCVPDVVVISSKYQDSLMDQVEKFVNANHVTTKIEHQRSFTLQKGEEFLSRVCLPDLSCPIVRGSENPSARLSPSEADEIDLTERSHSGWSGPATTIVSGSYAPPGFGDEGAGMGKVRLGMVKMGCWVNVDAPQAMAAVGGLMNYLWKSAQGSAEAQSFLDLTAVEAMAIQEHMLINRDALQSLAVLDFEGQTRVRNHNDPYQRSVLSLFNVYSHHVTTPMGRKLLHLWHLRPLLSLDALKVRHDAVEALSASENFALLGDLKRSLKKIKNVVSFVTKIRRGLGAVADWRGLVDALVALIQLQNDVTDIIAAYRLPIVEKVGSSMDPQLHDFAQRVVDIIDWDESVQQKRVAVKWGIDQELDDWRTNLAKMEPLLVPFFLTKAAREMLANGAVPADFCPEINVVSFPQIGYLVVCRPYEDQQLPLGWEQSFASDGYRYFKTPEMLNLDDHFGDLDGMIQDREIEIIQQLAEALRGVEGSLLASMDVIAELDCLIALASVVNDYNLVRPTMVEEPVLLIHEGKHILQDQCVPHYISNSTAMAGGDHPTYRSMFIVSGANGSGKSLYGKQVALIAYMAQIGSFVPAQSATIGICDKIFTRMQTRESVSKPASAFMIDLAQVSHALRGATERSLIILDEFGKGTTPADGGGLLAGVVEHLIQGPKPRTIVLTHFHELFANQFLPKTAPVIFCHMQTMMKQDAEGLIFLYRMKAGLAKTSNAAECALLHGVPPKVVERGRQVTHALTTFTLSTLFSKPLTPLELLDMQEGEDLCRRFLSWDIGATPSRDDGADRGDEEGVAELIDYLRDLVEGVEEEWADKRASAKRGEELRGLLEMEEAQEVGLDSDEDGEPNRGQKPAVPPRRVEGWIRQEDGREIGRALEVDSEEEGSMDRTRRSSSHVGRVIEHGHLPLRSAVRHDGTKMNDDHDAPDDDGVEYNDPSPPLFVSEHEQEHGDVFLEQVESQSDQDDDSNRQSLPIKREKEDMYWVQSEEARRAFWGHGYV